MTATFASLAGAVKASIEADLALGEGSALGRALAEASTQAVWGDDPPPAHDPLAAFLRTKPFGCQTPHAARLAAILTGIPGLAEVRTFDHTAPRHAAPPGCVVVPTVPYLSHNYPLDRPAICFDTRQGYRADGTPGNYLSPFRGHFRPPTATEAAEVLLVVMRLTPYPQRDACVAAALDLAARGGPPPAPLPAACVPEEDDLDEDGDDDLDEDEEEDDFDEDEEDDFEEDE